MISEYDTRGLDLFHRRQMMHWARLWGVPGLEERVDVSFSRRMSRALGRCTPARGRIRLNAPLLIPRPALLTEVLCHELAHVAVFALVGNEYRPHGREWSGLMRAAGYRPRLRLDVDRLSPSPRTGRSVATVYEHVCPVCEAARVAPRPSHRWRCTACVSAGREGRLLIRAREGDRPA